MKNALLLILVLFSTHVFGQLKWESVPSIPEYGRYTSISFSVNGKLYVGLGHIPGGGYSNQLWEYDPLLNCGLKKVTTLVTAEDLLQHSQLAQKDMLDWEEMVLLDLMTSMNTTRILTTGLRKLIFLGAIVMMLLHL